jgi:hypothetical protein
LIVAALNIPSDVQSEALTQWKAVASAIFTVITQHALVLPVALIAPPGAAGGPVTGTGTIT